MKNLIIKYGRFVGILLIAGGCGIFLYGASPWCPIDEFLYGFFVALTGFALWVIVDDHIHYKKMDQFIEFLCSEPNPKKPKVKDQNSILFNQLEKEYEFFSSGPVIKKEVKNKK